MNIDERTPDQRSSECYDLLLDMTNIIDKYIKDHQLNGLTPGSIFSDIISTLQIQLGGALHMLYKYNGIPMNEIDLILKETMKRMKNNVIKMEKMESSNES